MAGNQKYSIVGTSEILGVSRSAVYKWLEKGCPQNRDGSLSIAQVFAWRREADRQALESGRPADGDTTELDRLRAEKMRKDISLKDLDLQEKLAELVPRAQLADMARERGMIWCQIVQQIPRFAVDFVGLETLEQARERLLVLCNKINDVWKPRFGVTVDATTPNPEVVDGVQSVGNQERARAAVLV